MCVLTLAIGGAVGVDEQSMQETLIELEREWELLHHLQIT